MGKKAASVTMLTLLLIGTLALAFNIQLTKADDIYDLLDEREGFGRNTYGGRYGAVYHVTTLADSGPGSLRAGAESDDPLWIVFDVSGTIHLTDLIRFESSDKTIDGRGADITITGYGFQMRGDRDASNIIVTHLVFDTGIDDGIRIIYGAHDIWVHHCSFTNWGDGCLDITRASYDITVSWCRFWNHDKTMLIGADPTHTDDVVMRVTLHHNFFNGTVQRHPRLRFGKVDAYNNYLYDWGIYGMGVAMYGELLVEANIFEAGDNKDAVITSVGADPESGYSKLVNNLLENGAIANENGPEQVFNRSTYYNATIETADNALKAKIVAGAGAGTPVISPRPPEASFTYTPSYPIINQTVTFNASTSSSGFNGTHSVPIANYTWDFGDLNVTVVDAPTVTVTHVYSSAGNFTVNLTVTCMDDPVLIVGGLTKNSTWKNVSVSPPPPPRSPVASFTMSSPPYCVNETITFDASSSEPGFNGTHSVPIANYTWDFGDLNVTVTSDPTITHKYVAEGVYNVTLNVTDNQGLWNTTTETIKVSTLAVTDFTITLPFGASAIYTGRATVNSSMPPLSTIYPCWGAYPEKSRQIRISVTVENRGAETENFTVTSYYDDQVIHDYYGNDTQTVTNLAPGENITLTFCWDTQDVNPCDTVYPQGYSEAGYYIPYSISVNISHPTLGDIKAEGGQVTARILGDANGDGHCRGGDFTFLGMSWWTEYPWPDYDWRSDFNGDGDVKGEDFTMLAMLWYEY